MNYIVVGDFFIDRYWVGTSNRISPEAPVPVVKVEKMKEFAGGAGNVAENIRGLMRGDGNLVIVWIGGEPPRKNRLMVGDHQVARWDVGDSCEDLRKGEELPIIAGPLVVADYGKGTIGSQGTKVVVEATRLHRTYIDTKDTPVKFMEGELLSMVFFPNLQEYTQYERDYRLIAGLGAKVVVKMGAKGIGVLEEGKLQHKHPATCKTPYSVIGAGDTVIAAYCVAETEKLGDALELANRAAGIKVHKKFTAVVRRDEWLS